MKRFNLYSITFSCYEQDIAPPVCVQSLSYVRREAYLAHSRIIRMCVWCWWCCVSGCRICRPDRGVRCFLFYSIFSWKKQKTYFLHVYTIFFNTTLFFRYHPSMYEPVALSGERVTIIYMRSDHTAIQIWGINAWRIICMLSRLFKD